jgi:hypothetical protein
MLGGSSSEPNPSLPAHLQRSLVGLVDWTCGMNQARVSFYQTLPAMLMMAQVAGVYRQAADLVELCDRSLCFRKL